MNSSSGAARAPSPVHIHRRALALAGMLLLCFVAAAGLYSRYGYAVVLRVYEEVQVGRAEGRTGKGKLIEFEDYLRIDPANLRMRGLLVNQLIEFQDSARALDSAQAGLAAAAPGERPVALLLVARAQIAGGSLEAAAQTYGEVLSAAGESGEAHHGLARIAAARGDFGEMRQQYEHLARGGVGTSTHEYRALASFRESREGIQGMGDKYRLQRALRREANGDAEDAIEMTSDAIDFEGASAALFLRGVYEERERHRDAALEFYKRAADAGDGLGAFAYRRLSEEGDPGSGPSMKTPSSN